MSTRVKCAFCGGTGDETGHRHVCRVCQGHGTVVVPYDTPVKCAYCNGTGDETGHRKPCPVCRGVGVVAPMMVDNR